MTVMTVDADRAPRTPAISMAPYTLYGLAVSSDLPLPVPLANGDLERAVDLSFRLAGDAADAPPTAGELIAWAPCAIHGADARVTRGDDGTWIWHRAIGTFLVSADARQVAVYPNATADPRAVGLTLAGPVALYMLHRRGRPSLHATAVHYAGRTIAFLGEQGHGKSTMAAGFIADGATLLTDDALPLEDAGDVIYGHPGLPFMKVWTATAECALGLTGELPDLMDNYAKKYLDTEGRMRFATSPLPLDAVLLLRRYDAVAAGRDDVAITRLDQADAVMALLAQTSNRSYLLPREQAGFLAPYARLATSIPVAILSYPSGFEFLPDVRQRILEYLA
ncbi:MAG TPA: hypothetical protein VFV93_09615 [Thermomicrobiales bacterium]|nr:hypothetical protein [Thermomicrobiales bacterium]